MLKPTPPQEVVHRIISPNGFYPNNAKYPLLIYKQLCAFNTIKNEVIQAFLKSNRWSESWVDGIYDFHHYHSNTHETLVIIAGCCEVQIGGEQGQSYMVNQGDVMILPAGVAHKSLQASPDFKCIGAYPLAVGCDMHYGKAEDHPQVDENIKKVGLPPSDPIFGKNGLLFDYWSI